MRPQTHWVLKDKHHMRNTLAWQAQFVALAQSLKWPEQTIIYCIWGMLRPSASTIATVTFIQVHHREQLLFCVKVSVLSTRAKSRSFLNLRLHNLLSPTCLSLDNKLKGREWGQLSNSPKEWRQNKNLTLPMLCLSYEAPWSGCG